MRFFDVCTSKSCSLLFLLLLLFLSVSLSPPHCPSSHLSRLHPPRLPLLAPPYPVFSSRISSFFHAGPRVCAVQSPRKVFVWRFRRVPPFLLLQPQSPIHLSSTTIPFEHPEGWTRDEIFWRIPPQISVRAHRIAVKKRHIITVINEHSCSCVDGWKPYRSRATSSPLFFYNHR